MKRRNSHFPRPPIPLAGDSEEMTMNKEQQQFGWVRRELTYDLAEESGNKPERIRGILDRMDSVEWIGQPQDALSQYYPLLRTVQVLGIKDAIAIFEHIDLQKLDQRNCAFHELGHPGLPFYSIDELLQLLRDFVAFLKANRAHLVKFGHPAQYFAPSMWLDALLGRLYYDRLPVLVDVGHGTYFQDWECEWLGHGIPRTFGRWLGFREGETIPLRYIWSRGEGDDLPRPGFRRVAIKTGKGKYSNAPMIPRLTKEDATYLKELRPRVHTAKICVLKRACRFLKSDADGDLFLEATGIIRSCEISLEDVQFLLSVEAKYTRVFEQSGDISRGLPGGLEDLFRFVSHCEEENRTRRFDQIRRTLGDMIMRPAWRDWGFSVKGYYELLGHSKRDGINNALDEYWRWSTTRRATQNKCWERVDVALARSFQGAFTSRTPGDVEQLSRGHSPNSFTPQIPILSGKSLASSRQEMRKLELVVDKDSASINGCLIVSKSAPVRFAILKILCERFTAGLLGDPKHPGLPVTVREFCKILDEKRNRQVSDAESVRKNINRFQAHIVETLRTQLDIEIDREDVVENYKWKHGPNRSGFRLNPKTLVLLPPKMS